MLSRACFVKDLLLSSGLAGCRRCSRSKLCLQARGRTLSPCVPSTCHRPIARQLRSCRATSRQPVHTSAAQMEAQAPVDTCAADNPLLSVRSQTHCAYLCHSSQETVQVPRRHYMRWSYCSQRCPRYLNFCS